MSIVTAGAGNFASDWADALNTTSVTIIGSDGEKTQYNASADTDLARGTALKTALAALADGDTLVINKGVYETTGTIDLSSLTDFSIVGIGSPLVKISYNPNTIYTALDIRSATGKYSISGVRFEATDTAAVSGVSYGYIFYGTGEFKDCTFAMNFTQVVDVAGSKKNIVTTASEFMQFFNCDIVTSYTGVTSGHNSTHMATHDATNKTVFTNCRFFGNDIDYLYSAAEEHILVNCRGSKYWPHFDAPYLSYSEMDNKVSAAWKTAAGFTSEFTWAAYKKDINHTFTGDSWYTIFAVTENADIAGAQPHHHVRFKGSVGISNIGQPQPFVIEYDYNYVSPNVKIVGATIPDLHYPYIRLVYITHTLVALQIQGSTGASVVTVKGQVEYLSPTQTPTEAIMDSQMYFDSDDPTPDTTGATVIQFNRGILSNDHVYSEKSSDYSTTYAKNGDIYFNTTSKVWRVFVDGAWANL